MKITLSIPSVKVSFSESDFSDIEKDLYVRPIKAKYVKKNCSAVCQYYGDVALVLYRKDGDIKEIGKESYSWVDRKDLINWHVTVDEAFEAALHNAATSEENRAIVLNADDLHGFNGLQYADNYEYTDVPEGIILSTKEITNGAVAAFYPELMRKIAGQLDSDLLVMFPSQFVVVIYSEKSHSATDLQDALNLAVKEEGYKRSHHLSRFIFRYSLDRKQLNTV